MFHRKFSSLSRARETGPHTRADGCQLNFHTKSLNILDAFNFCVLFRFHTRIPNRIAQAYASVPILLEEHYQSKRGAASILHQRTSIHRKRQIAPLINRIFLARIFVRNGENFQSFLFCCFSETQKKRTYFKHS